MKIKTNPLERRKPIRIIYWAVTILLLSLTLFFGRNSFIKMAQKKIEIANLQEKVDLLRTQNDSLRKENNELKTNPQVIEKIAREQLGYQKDGEKVFRFLHETPTSQEKKTGK